MSGAIWGVIHRNKNAYSTGIYTFDAYKQTYQADFYHELNLTGCAMKSALLDVRAYSHLEASPYYDADQGLIINADAILDNRDALCDLLNCADLIDLITDTELILKSYIKWGEACVKKLLGDFAFVIVHLNKETDGNENENKIFCARDPLGLRTLYYSETKETFSFGTLIHAAMDPGKTPSVNEPWLADTIAIPGILQQIRADETLYEGIKLLEPGHTLTIAGGDLKKTKYWSPYDRKLAKDLKKLSDQDVYEKFHNVFVDAVKQRLEGSANTAIFLSGGLDSTSIAGVAAHLVAGTSGLSAAQAVTGTSGLSAAQAVTGTSGHAASPAHKNLYCFTSIPEFETQDAGSNDAAYEMPNESAFVDALVKKWPELISEKHAFPGKNALTPVDELLKILEVPYKYIVNSQWYFDFIKMARAKGCKVILTGSYGNLGFSSGEYLPSFAKCVYALDFKNAREIYKRLAESYKGEERLLFNTAVKELLPRPVRKIIRTIRFGKVDDLSPSFLKKDVIDRYEIHKRLYASCYSTVYSSTFSKRETDLVLSPFVLNQMSEGDVKEGLSQGVILRDPTRDRRVLEMSLNISSCLKCNEEGNRLLARSAMGRYLPAEIKANETCAGIQSADFLQRMESVMPQVINKVTDRVAGKTETRILDSTFERLLDYDNIINTLEALKHTIVLDSRKVQSLIKLFVMFEFFEKSNLSLGGEPHEKLE